MPTFVRVASISELEPGTAKTVTANGQEIAIYNVDGKIYATDNTCVHEGGPLGEGLLQGELISCPWHMWDFNVCTGELVNNCRIKLNSFPVEIDGTDIKVGV